jgi:hypothetical protein
MATPAPDAAAVGRPVLGRSNRILVLFFAKFLVAVPAAPGMGDCASWRTTLVGGFLDLLGFAECSHLVVDTRMRSLSVAIRARGSRAFSDQT